MIRKVLVANRGEIAGRVIAACRELGLATVAVYSEADRDGPWVGLADEAVAIGPPEPAESYLDIERLLGAAEKTGADALHPGYGFRAESADLAIECAHRGVLFIGPSPEALRRLGDKRAARELARRAGVPVVPGFEGSPADAARAAREIGYPLLVKAALGGGGKGMRRVDTEAELAPALEAAARVAASAFGDDSVYVERYLDNVRHVEVQVLGDGRGGAIHLGERECSLQRRHQKVMEESPSPALDAATRDRLCQAACALARAAGYLSAGTCEFLLEDSGRFHFLEVNARIQVEHPVTEAVTGFDLVKAQLALAQGASLPAQEAIAFRGHAVEARLTAEDPEQGFLPQAGRLLRFDLPRQPFLRIDTGFAATGVVPSHYDSLLAKVIAWGRDREEAWTRLRGALDEVRVHGVRTNLGLLRFLARTPEVSQGRLSTALLERELLPRFLAASQGAVPPRMLAAAALAEIAGFEPAHAAAAPGAGNGGEGDRQDPFLALGRFRLGGRA